MRVLKAFGLLVLATAACGDTANVNDFVYGGGQPGAKLAEGGEIRHENVRILGQLETWIMVYQYTAPSTAVTAPFAGPPKDCLTAQPYGCCVDERTSATWPVHPITGATYIDLSKVELTGPGITGTLSIPKSNPPNTVGNSTFRTYGFTYGGGALNATAGATGFNATLTPAEATPGANYVLDIGKGAPAGTTGTTATMTYHMPEAFTAPLGIGGAATVMIKAHQPLEYSWTTPKNDKGASGVEHNRNTYFNFTFFVDPTAPNPPQFICFPDVDGHQVVPTAVIDLIPAGGLIVNANLSHWMDAREASGPTDVRRFDLVSIYCNISAYSKQ